MADTTDLRKVEGKMITVPDYSAAELKVVAQLELEDLGVAAYGSRQITTPTTAERANEKFDVDAHLRWANEIEIGFLVSYEE